MYTHRTYLKNVKEKEKNNKKRAEFGGIVNTYKLFQSRDMILYIASFTLDTRKKK